MQQHFLYTTSKDGNQKHWQSPGKGMATEARPSLHLWRTLVTGVGSSTLQMQQCTHCCTNTTQTATPNLHTTTHMALSSTMPFALKASIPQNTENVLFLSLANLPQRIYDHAWQPVKSSRWHSANAVNFTKFWISFNLKSHSKNNSKV